MSANKAAAEKLPIAARKNVRDGWEAKKPKLEAQLLDLLGIAWTFEVNPLVIYPYADPDSYGSNTPGDCIFAYCDGFVWNLKNFIAKHGDSGKDELNSVCPTHIITLVASPKVSYCGCDVEDGKLRLVFHPEKLGTNISHVGQELAETLSTAPQPAGAPSLNYAARYSIKTEYDPKIGALAEKGRKLLHNAEFKFDPDFDALGAKLKGVNDVSLNWESNFGSYCFKYFESFVDALEREKFGDDELLREGLEEAAAKGTVKLRLVDSLKSGANEVLVDDGVLVIQTTPEKWGTNIHYACEKLVDIL